MMMRLLSLPVVLLSLAVPASASLSSKLASRPELSQFNAYLSQFPRLATIINTADNATLLAPTDTAITKWLQTQNPPLTASDIENTLSYHILHGAHPVASFTNAPQFVASFLTNASYSNVTNGLPVGLVKINGEPQIRSGLNANSSIITPDLIANGGLIHVLDSVLQLPKSQSTTATALDLNFYIAILQAGNFLTSKASAFGDAIVGLSDVTYFFPNTAEALATFKSKNGNLTQQQREEMLKYHVVSGFVGVESQLFNKEILRTLQGRNLTITVRPDGSKYVNNAKIIATDYLINNGIMHTIDGLLDPNNITAPVFSQSSLPISTGALAGIVVGGLVLGSLLAVGVWFYIRRKKREPAAGVFLHGKSPSIESSYPIPTRIATYNSSNRSRSQSGSTRATQSRGISRPLYELEPHEKATFELDYTPRGPIAELEAVKRKPEAQVYRDPVTQRWTTIKTEM